MEGKNTNQSEHNGVRKARPRNVLPAPVGTKLCPPLCPPLWAHQAPQGLLHPSATPALQPSKAGPPEREGMNTHLGVGMGGWGQELTGRQGLGCQAPSRGSIPCTGLMDHPTESRHRVHSLPSPPSSCPLLPLG